MNEFDDISVCAKHQIFFGKDDCYICDLQSSLTIALDALREIQEHEHKKIAFGCLPLVDNLGFPIHWNDLERRACAIGHECCAAIATTALEKINKIKKGE